MRSITTTNSTVYYTIARDHPEVLLSNEYNIVLISSDTDREVSMRVFDSSDYKSSYQEFTIPAEDLRPYGAWYIKIYHEETLVHSGLLAISE